MPGKGSAGEGGGWAPADTKRVPSRGSSPSASWLGAGLGRHLRLGFGGLKRYLCCLLSMEKLLAAIIAIIVI